MGLRQKNTLKTLSNIQNQENLLSRTDDPPVDKERIKKAKKELEKLKKIYKATNGSQELFLEQAHTILENIDPEG